MPTNLLKEFNNKASALIDEQIRKFEYWKEKFRARGKKPTPEDEAAQFQERMQEVSKKMSHVIKNILSGNENQEISYKIYKERGNHIRRFIKVTAPADNN